MIRYYCDICAKRIVEPEAQIVGKGGRISFSITRSVDGAWGGGHVCRACILAAIIDGLRVEET